MTDTPPLDLDAIEQRANAASDGPWWNDSHEIYAGHGTSDDQWIGETCNIDLLDAGAANGAFLAAARQDVPALVAEIRRLRAEVVERRDQVLTEAAEPLCVRLWLIEQYVARITAGDDPVAVGLDLTPYLDGPIHRDHVAAYHAARTTTALES